jgi:zinc transport system substrate-binding protein
VVGVLLAVSGEARPISVLVTLSPYREFVQAVGGGHVQVTTLIAPGVSDEVYEPDVAMLKAVSHAQLYFQVGRLPLERNLSKQIKALNPKLRLVDLSKHLPLRSSDPHIWMSLPLVQMQVTAICRALCELDPTNRNAYIQNRDRFLTELGVCDREIKHRLDLFRGRAFLAVHPMLGYFAYDYGLIQIGVDVHDEKPLSTRDLSQLLAQARQKKVKMMVVVPDSPSSVVSALSRTLSLSVVRFNPSEGTYVARMRNLSIMFERNLK